jgi:hypothetical protein
LTNADFDSVPRNHRVFIAAEHSVSALTLSTLTDWSISSNLSAAMTASFSAIYLLIATDVRKLSILF